MTQADCDRVLAAEFEGLRKRCPLRLSHGARGFGGKTFHIKDCTSCHGDDYLPDVTLEKLLVAMSTKGYTFCQFATREQGSLAQWAGGKSEYLVWKGRQGNTPLLAASRSAVVIIQEDHNAPTPT